MSKILLTGATGYENYLGSTALLTGNSFIGGEVLHTLARAGHSGLHITSLVRDASKAQQVHLAYPNVKTILGDLDDTELIKEQSKAADLVLSMHDVVVIYSYADFISRFRCHWTRSERKGHCGGLTSTT